jgi:hypothetical protein
MISRVRWTGIALLAMLPALPCLAADAPSDTTASRTGSVPGRGAVGGLVGASFFRSIPNDYSDGAQPRFDFSGHYRYVFSNHWRMQVSPGFTWAAYSDRKRPPFADQDTPVDTTKGSYLTLMVPISVQLQYTWGRGAWRYSLGAGPGLYRVWVENHRHVLVDPVTDRLHRGLYWGWSAETDVERFLKELPNTSLELSFAHHDVFARRDEQFPTGWNSTVGAFALRAGVNYYFDPGKRKAAPELPLPEGLR